MWINKKKAKWEKRAVINSSSIAGGARSFHAKYWDGDPSHDPFLKAIWREQKAEMEGFYRGRDIAVGR